MPLSTHQKSTYSVILIVVTVLFWSLLLYYYHPDEIVHLIGIENGYWIAFLIAVLGGVSTLTSFSLYAVIFTLSVGGLNPWLLGLSAGLGTVIGDSLFFYIGYKGRELVSGRLEKYRVKMTNWFKKRGKYFTPIFVFIYVGLTPLPNDIVMVAVATADQKYKTIFPALVLGDITAITIIAHLAKLGIEFS